MGALRVFAEQGTSVGHLVRLILRIPIGATGAPGTAVQAWGFGSTPLTRTGVGAYTVNLRDLYPANSLMTYGINTIQSTVSAGDGTWGLVLTENYSAAGPNLTIQMLASNTGAAAEIRSGATLLIELAFKNTVRPF